MNQRRFPSRSTWPSLLFGLLVLAAVLILSLHFGEVATLTSLLRQIHPGWLLVAVGLQAGTYLCVALSLKIAIRVPSMRPPLRSLLLLALSKQFVSRVVPTIGLSGNLVVVRGLQQRGAGRSDAVHAVLVSLFSYYLSFAAALGATILLLWLLRDLTPAILISLTVLLGVVVVISTVLFWLGSGVTTLLPGRVGKWLIAHEMEDLLPEAGAFHGDAGVLGLATLLQSGVFVLDAGTLLVVLIALRQPVEPAVVFVALTAAQALASVGLVPGGLGTFEGMCVAVLHAHKVPIEAALTGTLVLRGLTFWLPMLPGLWLTRRAVSAGRISAVDVTPTEATNALESPAEATPLGEPLETKTRSSGHDEST